MYSCDKYHLNYWSPQKSLSHNNRSLVRKLSRHTLLGIRLRNVRMSIPDFRNKFLCTTARSKRYEDGTTEQIYKQLIPHQTSCLRKFLTYPTAPSKLPTLKPESSGRVLTSADSIRDLEEKKWRESYQKKEENAKKREERAQKKLNRVKGSKAPNRLL